VEVEVVALERYLVLHTLENLDDSILRWKAAEGFHPEYKQLKSDRLQHLRNLKLAEDRNPRM
jgi:hypothetical protein